MLGEALCIDRCRGNQELELGAPGQQALHIAQQEIDVKTALVCLVDDDRVVGVEEAIRLRLGEENSIGHDPQEIVVTDAVAEAHAEAHLLPQRSTQLLGDARCDRSRCHAPGLRVRDHPGRAPLEFQADLGKLSGLARTGLTANDHDLMRGHRDVRSRPSSRIRVARADS